MDGSVSAERGIMSVRHREEDGMTLVESMMAILVLSAGLLMMAQVLAVSVIASKTHGRDAGKTVVSARDKMEELRALPFNASTLAAGEYVDYLNSDGTTGAAGSADYTRQWWVTDVSGTRKQIVVTVTSNRSFEYGEAPSTTLVSEKAP